MNVESKEQQSLHRHDRDRQREPGLSPQKSSACAWVCTTKIARECERDRESFDSAWKAPPIPGSRLAVSGRCQHTNRTSRKSSNSTVPHVSIAVILNKSRAGQSAFTICRNRLIGSICLGTQLQKYGLRMVVSGRSSLHGAIPTVTSSLEPSSRVYFTPPCETTPRPSSTRTRKKCGTGLASW